jgi:hypothetical protein
LIFKKIVLRIYLCHRCIVINADIIYNFEKRFV